MRARKFNTSRFHSSYKYLYTYKEGGGGNWNGKKKAKEATLPPPTFKEWKVNSYLANMYIRHYWSKNNCVLTIFRLNFINGRWMNHEFHCFLIFHTPKSLSSDQIAKQLHAVPILELMEARYTDLFNKLQLSYVYKINLTCWVYYYTHRYSLLVKS